MSDTKITTIAGALSLVSTAIAAQSGIEVVSATIEKLNGKTEGQPKGERVHLQLQGPGVTGATRRYFLREKSAFASTIRGVGLIMGHPKKDRNAEVYDLYFGLDADVTNWQPAPPVKAEKVKMTKEEAAAARLAGKRRKAEQRASEAAARAEAAARGDGGQLAAA